MNWGRFFDSWKGLRAFQKLPPESRRLVFYSEGGAYWVHLEPLVTRLARHEDTRLCYVSSDPADPGLHQAHPNVLPFFIGDGSARTIFFKTLEAKVLAMTMPDLETFHIKRSVHPVHYIYVHHSIVSTHMIYRPAAFYHFDTVFCVGPHHVQELREAEQLYGLKPRHLVEHGYGRLDRILQAAPEPLTPGRRILIAPSWGPQALLEEVGEPLVAVLLEAGFQVTVRPHPQTRRFRPEVLDGLVARFKAHEGFRYEENVASQDSLHQSDLIISDWSGAALEYAFGKERPVLFVDVPRKVNNPDYTDFKSVPLEVSIREEIGRVIAPDAIQSAPAVIDEMLQNRTAWTDAIRQARSRWVYNLGASDEAGARYIKTLL